MDEELRGKLLQVDGGCKGYTGPVTCWNRNPEGPQAVALIDMLHTTLATARAETAAKDDLLRECMREFSLFDSFEAGSRTDLLCDRILDALASERQP